VNATAGDGGAQRGADQAATEADEQTDDRQPGHRQDDLLNEDPGAWCREPESRAAWRPSTRWEWGAEKGHQGQDARHPGLVEHDVGDRVGEDAEQHRAERAQDTAHGRPTNGHAPRAAASPSPSKTAIQRITASEWPSS
jgi:hypothetical protein